MLRFAGEVKQEFLDGITVTQDQAYISALAVDFFISLLNTVEAWAERTLAEIETWDDLMPSTGRTSGRSKSSASCLLLARNRLEEAPVPLAAAPTAPSRAFLCPVLPSRVSL